MGMAEQFVETGGQMLGLGAGFLGASQNRKFQKYMATHAIRNRVADAEAAGVNPLVLFPGGAAADTPSGSNPQLGPPVGTGLTANKTARDAQETQAKAVDQQIAESKSRQKLIAAQAIDALASARKLGKDIDQIDAAIGKITHEMDLIDAQTGTEFAKQGHLIQQDREIDSVIDNLEYQNKNLEARSGTEYVQQQKLLSDLWMLFLDIKKFPAEIEGIQRANEIKKYEARIKKLQSEVEGSGFEGRFNYYLDKALRLIHVIVPVPGRKGGAK